jgi:hypothetical protein
VGVRIRGDVGEGHGGGVMGGCCIHENWWRGLDWQPLLERCHLVLLSLAREVLQLLRDDLHLLHNLSLNFFA